jgi:FlaA1/EpsC-like NDP-sugar epimerase
VSVSCFRTVHFLFYQPLSKSTIQLINRSTAQQMNKIVFITGATAGFGKASAEKFAANKYDLIITGRRENLLYALQKELENNFGVEVLYQTGGNK